MHLYGLPALPLAALGIPAHVQIPAFYAGDLGLGLAATGASLAAARLIDLAADLLVGLTCDRGGQTVRRRWLLAGLPLLILGGWLLFIPRFGAGPVDLVVSAGLFYLGLTTMTIPYQAWGAELSDDYATRTRIASWREGFSLLGILLAVTAPALLPLRTDRFLCLLFLVCAGILVAATVVAVRLVPDGILRPRPRHPSTWRPLAANAPFRRLILAQGLNALANALPASLFVLYVGAGVGRPDRAPLFLLAYFVAAILGIPVWLTIAGRLGKHRSWRLSLMVTAICFAPAALLGSKDQGLFLAICVATGFGLAADLTLPASMLADVVDEHAAVGGGGRAGLYVALWSLLGKLALALAVGIAFPLLAHVSFQPTGENSAPALAMLGLLYAGAPAILKLGAALAISGFSLDEIRQRALQQRITSLTET